VELPCPKCGTSQKIIPETGLIHAHFQMGSREKVCSAVGRKHPKWQKSANMPKADGQSSKRRRKVKAPNAPVLPSREVKCRECLKMVRLTSKGIEHHLAANGQKCLAVGRRKKWISVRAVSGGLPGQGKRH